MPLVGVYHRQPILYMSKLMIHYYSTDNTMNQFEIGEMINPSINCNKVFREKFQKCLSSTFHSRIMETIIDCTRKNNACVMALLMFYENNGVKTKKVYRLLS